MVADSAPRSRFVVGVDLGTTNTVVASGRVDSAPPEVFSIEQRVGRRESSSLPFLPSCAFSPLEGELEDAGLDEPPIWTTGSFAKKRGGEAPARFVASAKSWLCHPTVDKQSPILPWGEEGVPKLSPVEVATMLLGRIRRSWDRAHPDALLVDQNVVVTVPASFDEVARELTLEAAKLAGLRVRLLEEPQAAFHAAIGVHALDRMPHGGYAVVVDIGGGTTDLSLISVERHPGDATDPDATQVKRVAVGRHLLLGGDNMDLALAHALEAKLVQKGESLEPRLFAELVVAARDAKEKLLGEVPPDSYPITISRRGSALIGSTLRTELGRDECNALVLEGFFPMVDRHAPPPRTRAGLVGFGLPYERDAAITRHLAAFVSRQLPRDARVEAVLVNGGVFHSRAIRERLLEVFGFWQDQAPTMLPHADPDEAVAIGAVLFGRSLLGHGQRIRGGSARAFFLGVGIDKDTRAERAVCVLPKGVEEGVQVRAKGSTFHLSLGREVRFDLYSSDTDFAGRPGDVVDRASDFDKLPPLVCKLPSDAKRDVMVEIESELTPVGTVDIHCISTSDAGQRFRLAFALRSPDGEISEVGPPSLVPGSIAPRSRGPARDASNVNAAVAEIERVFGKSKEGTDPREAKDLLRSLEKLLGERATWTADLSRSLADVLLSVQKGRKRSLDHERVFLLLTGFCLRPGFGAPGDPQRLAQFLPVLRERVAFPKETRTWQQYFIAVRRSAGGLTETMQTQLRDDLDPLIAPAEAKLKKPKGPRPESLEDVWDLLSHLERVPAIRRTELASWFLERTWTSREPRIWASIGRIAARIPAYASVHHVVAVSHAERFIDHLLREKWADLPSAPRALSEMARLTEDRARDVSQSVRSEVIKRLEREKVDAELIRAVREKVETKESDRLAFFGESLPSGLRLVSVEP